MSLNIKNTRTHGLVRELSRLTGESQTAAVTHAVEERLARLRREQGREQMADRLLEIGRNCAGLWRSGGLDVDDLYDEETGLPR